MLLISVSASAQTDTCITKVVYDSLATGNQIAHDFGQSGYMENVFEQSQVKSNLITNLEKQVKVTETMNTTLILSARKLSSENAGLKYKIKGLRFQIPIVAFFAGFVGYAIGAK